MKQYASKTLMMEPPTEGASTAPKATSAGTPDPVRAFVTAAKDKKPIAEVLAAAAAGAPDTCRIMSGRGNVHLDGQETTATQVRNDLDVGDLWTPMQAAIVAGHGDFSEQTWDDLRTVLAAYGPGCDGLIKAVGLESKIDKAFNPTAKAGIVTELLRLPANDGAYIKRVQRTGKTAQWGYAEKSKVVRGGDGLSNARFDAMMAPKDQPLKDGESPMRQVVAKALDARGIDEAVDLVAYSVRHEIGHAMDRKHSADSATLRDAAGWKRVTTEEFVKACEPKLTGSALTEAVNALAPVFGGGSAESAKGKGGEDGLSPHQQLEATLKGWTEAKTNLDLVKALQMSRVGKSLPRHQVTGGYAQASFIVSSLAILDSALYQRLQAWNNPFAMVSSKEWVAEIYAQAMQPGFDIEAASYFGDAEKAFIKAVNAR